MLQLEYLFELVMLFHMMDLFSDSYFLFISFVACLETSIILRFGHLSSTSCKYVGPSHQLFLSTNSDTFKPLVK